MVVAFSRQWTEPEIPERELVQPLRPVPSEPEDAGELYARELEAVEADCGGGAGFLPLAEVWERLSTGTARVRASFSTDTRSYLILESATPGPTELLALKHVPCLERLLLGVRQKVTAYDAQRSLSTVSMRAARCLRAMGISRPFLQVPLLVIMAANAYHGGWKTLRARWSRLGAGAEAELVISVPRLDPVLTGRLSPAECCVAQMLVEGCSHAEIGVARRRSPRTIANQLGAVFSKLRVSGRMELVRYLLDATLLQAPARVGAAH